MFTPVGQWNALPPLFQRNGDGIYQYVGNCIFKSVGDGSYWKWAPEKRTPQTAERFDSISADKVVEDARALFWPAFSAIAEADPSRIPELKVASTSIRNFETTPNGVSLIGVLHLPTATIHLAPLVSRNDDTDAPSNYDQNFAHVGRPSHAPVQLQDRQYLSQGRFVRPMEDTRKLGIGQKNARTNGANAMARESWEQVQAIHGILNQLKKFNRGPQALTPTRQKPGQVVTGTAHLQLQSTITAIELEAMGFAVERINLQSASFTSTSGTLNTAHFNVIHLKDNWQRQIMAAIARDLRVELVHQKVTPDTPRFGGHNLRGDNRYGNKQTF